MKLYLKVNNLKTLQNVDTLVYGAVSKASLFVDRNSPVEYRLNLQSAKVLNTQRESLFYSDKPLLQSVKGVYFGNSSCEHLISPLKELAEAYFFCKKRHWNFVYLFAPLSPFSFESAKEILGFLDDKKASVVVNDFGLLQVSRAYKNITVILGLNFTKMIKNAFIDILTPTDADETQLENQKRLAEHIEFENEDVRAFYKGLGIGRFGVENLNIAFDFIDKKPKMQIDFYYPYITISSSKACDIAGLYHDRQNYFVSESCNKHCLHTALEFEQGDIFGFYQRYNSIYKSKTSLHIPELMKKDDKNRLVWELFL